MVLADTRAEADSDEAREGRFALAAAVRERGPAAAADAVVPKLLGPRAGADPATVRRVRELILENGAGGIADALAALRTRPDSTALLPTIRCPTLVLVGEADQLTPVAMADTLAQGIAGAALVRIPDAGHLSNLESPDLFAASLWRFVRGLP
jgi:pimeloyl-ACP methyl ester carboxylesterase